MTSFIITCIIVGALLIWGLFLLVIYVTSKNDMLATTRKSCLIWAAASIVLSAILAGSFLSQYSQCPNPTCKEWVDSSYCEKCGWEVHATIDCPTCENKFDADNAPAFCPDCGTEVKE